MYLKTDVVRVVNLEKDTLGVLLDSWYYFFGLEKSETETQDFWPQDYKTYTNIKRNYKNEDI